MKYDTDTYIYELAEIERRAHQLRGEATAHGVRVAMAWIAAKFATLFHRGRKHAA